MVLSEPDTEELLDRSAAGDAHARDQLLDRHRERLMRMVSVRLDHRLAPRLDPSDVVQDVFAEAVRRLDDYLRDRPLAFYPWLRQIACDRLVDIHRRHVTSRKRSVRREDRLGLSEESEAQLAERLFARGSSPSHQAERREQRRRVHEALAALSEQDREVLVLRHLEQLSVSQTAEVLGISESAAKMRHVRALARLEALLNESGGGQ